MPAADQGTERTETATQKKRQDARRKGQVPRSSDFTTAAVLLGGAGALWIWGGRIVDFFALRLRTNLANPADTLTRDAVVSTVTEIIRSAAAAVLPVMLALYAVAILANLVQFGFLLSGEAVVPKFDRLNPVAGFKRIFSLSGLVKLSVGVLKMIVIVGIAAWFCWDNLVAIISSQQHSGAVLANHIASLAVKFSLTLGVGLFVLALLDFLFQRWKHEQDLKMTMQEVRDEIKEQEGDPWAKQRRKEAHQKLTVARELQQVPDADVVITNPTELAIAVKYDPKTMPAPTVIAKGADLIAQRIREIAAAHGVPIIERKPLAQTLYKQVKTGQTIPLELYDVFIEILAYVYRVTGRPLPDLGL